MLGPILVLVVLFVRARPVGLVPVGARPMADALLEVRGLTKRFGGAVGERRHRPRGGRGRDARRHRPERRRQDDAASASSPATCAPTRARSASPARTSPRSAAPRARAAWPRALVPDHQHLSRLHRARQRRAGGAGARRPQLPLLASGARRRGAARAGRARCSSEVGLGARADVLAANLAHGEQRQLEIGDGAGDEAALLLLDEPMAGMGVEESQRMVELLRDAASGKHTHDPRRARHGRGVRARRPHLACWSTAASSRPARRRRSASTRKSAAPISARTTLMLEVDATSRPAYGRSQVLFGVSLRVDAGQVVTLLGRNGMGKTTTVRAIMGIIPSAPAASASTDVALDGLPPLPDRPGRPRPGARGPPGVPEPHRAREPRGHRGQPPAGDRALDGRARVRRCFRRWRRARAASAARSPAASSRCSPSAAR